MQDLGDSRGQGGLAVVNVTDGPDVDVRLGPLELRLRHFCVLLDLLVLVKAVLMYFSCAAVVTGAGYSYASVYSPVAFAMISFDTFAGTSA